MCEKASGLAAPKHKSERARATQFLEMFVVEEAHLAGSGKDVPRYVFVRYPQRLHQCKLVVIHQRIPG